MSFCGYLRQSTAVDILMGPFIDDTDGKTAETGLTIDVELSKNGQPLADSESAAPTHDAAGTVDGYYNCILGTTDTATLGILTVVAHAAGFLPVRHDYQIVTANWYDTMCSTDNLDVNVTAMANDVITPAAVDEDADFVIQALSVTNQLDAGSVVIDAGMDIVGALSANSVLVDTTTTLTGNVSCAAAFDVVGALTAGSVSIDGGFDVVGALSANSLLIDTTTTLTGAVTAPAGITADITGDIATCSAATVSAIGANVITATSINADAITEAKIADNAIAAEHLNATACTKIIDDFETQSQADPTGFHVNLKEINGTSVTGDGTVGTPWGPV